MTDEDAPARDAAEALTPATRDRFHIPTAPDGIAGDLPGRPVARAAATDRRRGDRHGARRLGAPRSRRMVRPGAPVVHAGRDPARVDGPCRRRPTGRDRTAQQPDRQHPPAARVVLPARGPAPADPRRRSALPVRPPRPDEPSRPARAGSGDGPGRHRTARRRASRPDRGPRDGHRRPGGRPRPRLPRRGQLRDRAGTRHRAADRRRPRRGRGRRLGPGPRRRQHRALAPRLGRRLRRLVHLQVPERRPRLGRLDLRPRAPRARRARSRVSGAGGVSIRMCGSTPLGRSRRRSGRPAGRPRRRRSSRSRPSPPHWRSSTRSGCRHYVRGPSRSQDTSRPA